MIHFVVLYLQSELFFELATLFDEIAPAFLVRTIVVGFIVQQGMAVFALFLKLVAARRAFRPFLFVFIAVFTATRKMKNHEDGKKHFGPICGVEGSQQ